MTSLSSANVSGIPAPCSTQAYLDDDALRAEAAALRAELVALSHRTRTPHLGSALSCVDILTAAYWGGLRLNPDEATLPERDRFILSKGHAAAALYLVLMRRGYYDRSVLDGFNVDGGCLQEHPGPACVPGVEAATGSLGHGLSIGLGMALAARMQGVEHRTCVVLGDGECNEGSVWEAAMMAGAHKLGSLRAVVDFNRWQATGRSCEILAMEPLGAKWLAFGWNVVDVDGHDPVALRSLLSLPRAEYGKPLAIIAHTTKGKGVSFMEDDNNWHYRIPTEDEVEQARKELLHS